MRSWTATILVIAFCCFNWLGAASEKPEAKRKSASLAIPVTVTRVIDGDTVACEIRYTIHVRLLDCWAEERGTAAGDEATKQLKKLAEGQPALLTVPVINGNLSRSISFGRVLGRVRIFPLDSNSDNGLDLSEWMVKNGYAAREKPKSKW